MFFFHIKGVKMYQSIMQDMNESASNGPIGNFIVYVLIIALIIYAVNWWGKK